MAKTLIDLIKILRDRTGAGLMDCKTALLNNDSDLEKATDWLREKGLAKAARNADRIAAEGLTVAKNCEKCGYTVILEVNCETDFVAKGDLFHQLVDDVAEVILNKTPATVEEAKNLTADLFTDATVKMGEKFDLRRFELINKTDDSFIYNYVHMGGKIAAAVVLDKEDGQLGKGLAMHIAANNPLYLTTADIGAEAIDRETKVQTEAAKNDEKLADKPEEMLKRIISGKVNKYFSEMVLAEQPYLMDVESNKKVGKILTENKVKILKYVRYQVGEGIEKRQDDFACEVMSQIKK
ncbi:MAG: elongation factor Ts [Erysipelotrichia bacterium]|nr:elongation factor Ts [Erysipelotrichia bacterium]